MHRALCSLTRSCEAFYFIFLFFVLFPWSLKCARSPGIAYCFRGNHESVAAQSRLRLARFFSFRDQSPLSFIFSLFVAETLRCPLLRSSADSLVSHSRLPFINVPPRGALSPLSKPMDPHGILLASLYLTLFAAPTAAASASSRSLPLETSSAPFSSRLPSTVLSTAKSPSPSSLSVACATAPNPRAQPHAHLLQKKLASWARQMFQSLLLAPALKILNDNSRDLKTLLLTRNILTLSLFLSFLPSSNSRSVP